MTLALLLLSPGAQADPVHDAFNTWVQTELGTVSKATINAICVSEHLGIVKTSSVHSFIATDLPVPQVKSTVRFEVERDIRDSLSMFVEDTFVGGTVDDQFNSVSTDAGTMSPIEPVVGRRYLLGVMKSKNALGNVSVGDPLYVASVAIDPTVSLPSEESLRSWFRMKDGDYCD